MRGLLALGGSRDLALRRHTVGRTRKRMNVLLPLPATDATRQPILHPARHNWGPARRSICSAFMDIADGGPEQRWVPGWGEGDRRESPGPIPGGMAGGLQE